MAEPTEQEYLRRRLLKYIITRMDEDKLPDLSAENRANIKRYKDCWFVAELAGLEILGVSEFPAAQLTYTERKAVSSYVEAQIRSSYVPLLTQLQEAIKRNDRQRSHILELHQKRQEMTARIAEVAGKKLELLQKIAAIRTGPHDARLCENLMKETQLTALKLMYLEKAIVSNIMTITSKTPDALMEIDRHLDEVLSRRKKK